MRQVRDTQTGRWRDKGRIKPSVNPNRSAINCWRLCAPLTQHRRATASALSLSLPAPRCSRPPSLTRMLASFSPSICRFPHFLSVSSSTVLFHGNFRRRSSSLPFRAPPQLDLCTISSALHFSYNTALLEGGRKGGRVVEDERRRGNCREGPLPPTTKQNVE